MQSCKREHHICTAHSNRYSDSLYGLTMAATCVTLLCHVTPRDYMPPGAISADVDTDVDRCGKQLARLSENSSQFFSSQQSIQAQTSNQRHTNDLVSKG